MKLLIINWAGLNTGDDAMLEAIVAKASIIFSDLEISIIGHHISSDISSRLNVKVVGDIFSTEKGLFHWGNIYSAVSWADAVLVGGGDIMRERVASLLPFAMASFLGKPVTAMSVGVVNISESAFWRCCYKLLMLSVSNIYVRDVRSYDMLNVFNRPSKLLLAPDVAFSHLAHDFVLSNSQVNVPSLNICVNLREINDSAYSGVMAESNVELLDKVENLIISFGIGNINLIKLIPMVDDAAVNITNDKRDSDLPILKLLCERLKVHNLKVKLIEKRPSGLTELNRYYEDVNIIIGSRYHFLIGALSTRAIIYAVPYAEKVMQLIKLVPQIKNFEDVAFGVPDSNDIDIRKNKVLQLSKQADDALSLMLKSLNDSNKQSMLSRYYGFTLSLLLFSEPLSRNVRKVIGVGLRTLKLR